MHGCSHDEWCTSDALMLTLWAWYTPKHLSCCSNVMFVINWLTLHWRTIPANVALLHHADLKGLNERSHQPVMFVHTVGNDLQSSALSNQFHLIMFRWNIQYTSYTLKFKSKMLSSHFKGFQHISRTLTLGRSYKPDLQSDHGDFKNVSKQQKLV